MFIAIFAKNNKIALNYLTNLIGEMKYKDVEYFAADTYPPKAKLKDGTLYLVLPLSDSARGIKYDKALVHRDIDILKSNNYKIVINGLIGNDIEYFE